MIALVSMLVLGAVSWVFRIAFITLLPAERLPARLQNDLEYLAPAVLAAIVAVELIALVRDAEPVDAVVLLELESRSASWPIAPGTSRSPAPSASGQCSS